ncbi:MAG: long-chain fatty acid--CoA ligase, partial [Aurantibacter sp.]
MGEGEKMPAALIQPNFEFVQEWIIKKKKKVGSSTEEIVVAQEVVDRIQKELDKCNKHFGKWEQIKVFRLTADAWTPDSGHLTPTMKMKRDVIKQKYIGLYNDMYDRS